MVSIVRTVILCLISTCDVVFVIGRVTIEKDGGGYRGLTVAISRDVPLRNDLKLINNIQVFFQLASVTFCNATKGKARFLDINLMVPNSWDIGDKSEVLFHEAVDFKIVNNEGFIDKNEPRAEQFGTCGVKGRTVYLPKAIFTDRSKPTKKDVLNVVKQWAVHRYGIFDEHGYPNDPLYPNYYVLAGTKDNPHINACTEKELIVETKTSSNEYCEPKINFSNGLPEDDGCTVQPKADSNQNVASSIMYSTNLENVFLFCGTDEDNRHNASAKTKHNALCNKKSVMEIIDQSPDFKDSKSNSNCNDIKVNFQLVKEGSLRVAFFLDVSKQMRNIDFYKALKYPLQQFIFYDIPLNTEAYLVKFDSDSTENSVRPINLTDYEAKKNFIGGMPDTLKKERRDLPFALKGFFNKVNTQTRVLMFTSTDSLTESDVDKLRDFVINTERCQLHLVLIRYEFGQPSPAGLEDAVTLSGGRMYELSVKGMPVIEIQQYMDGIFKAFLGKESSYIDINKVWVRHSKEDNLEFPFTIAEDSRMVESASVCLVQKAAYIYKESMKLTIGDSVFTNDDGSFSDDNGNEYVHYCFKLKGNAGPGSLSFPTKGAGYPLLVTTTLKLKYNIPQGEVLKLLAWTHIVKNEQNKGKVVIIYAQLQRGLKPVKQAKVTATITHPNQNGAERNVLRTFELNDNGLGDPDITEGDGIYSRYFTGFAKKGGYIVKVFANDNHNTAQVLKNAGTGWQNANKFERVLEAAASFQVDWDPPEADIYPPNRILDFRVLDVNGSRLTFEWTAPGDDYDGKRSNEANPRASKYEIKYFTEQENHTYKEFEEKGVEVTVLKSSGEPAKPSVLNTKEVGYAEVTISPVQKLFFALRASDDLSNASPESNVVEVQMGYEMGTDEEWNSATLIGIIVGSVAGAIIAFVIVIAVIFKLRRGLKSDDSDTSQDRTDSVYPTAPTFQSASQESLKPVFSIPELSAPIPPNKSRCNQNGRGPTHNYFNPETQFTVYSENLPDNCSMKTNSIYESYDEDLRYNINLRSQRSSLV